MHAPVITRHRTPCVMARLRPGRWQELFGVGKAGADSARIRGDLWSPAALRRSGASEPSKIEIFHIQGIAQYEITARFHFISHQAHEEFIGLGDILDAHLQEGASIRVERCFP